jgi:hypothetical protein
MFIQVIKGKTKDASGVRAALDQWEAELKPGASGYLGSTGGVADDGTFLMVARFASEDAARANSQRPEQGAWWNETSKLLDDVQFFDCPRVEIFMRGGSDDAGFVQVMVYKPQDIDALREAYGDFEKIAPERPDIIGATSGIATDGTAIDTTYFTSEREAREGEQKELAPELQATFQRFGELAGPVEYINLKDPWLRSA